MHTENIKINTIINKYKNHIKSKYVFFEMLHDLHTNVEFKTEFDYTKLFKTISNIYKDPKPLYNNDRYTPDPIRLPKDNKEWTENDVFVFGSNTEGRHGGGAAKVALDYYGAIYGQPYGLQGQSYGIVTKDLNIGLHSISYDDIEKQINDLIEFALQNKHLTFWVTKIGCGLGGYTINEIAPLFSNKIYPENIILPIEFVYPHYWCEYLYSPKLETFYHLSENHIIEICNKKDFEYCKKYPINKDYIFDKIAVDVVQSNKEDFDSIMYYILTKIK